MASRSVVLVRSKGVKVRAASLYRDTSIGNIFQLPGKDQKVGWGKLQLLEWLTSNDEVDIVFPAPENIRREACSREGQD